VAVNFGSIRFAGSALLGALIALVPTVVIYKVATEKAGAFIFFIPTAILATRLVLWANARATKEHSDSVRRRYNAGRPPVGK